ncbi:hypothetical protein [Streptomyces sp. NPDC047928]
MNGDDMTPGTRAPRPEEPSSRPPGRTELLGLVLLLALVTGVYLVTGASNFTLIIASVTGLYGLWRARR